jgi:diguanylate cyclase (GGDEF)-like protein
LNIIAAFGASRYAVRDLQLFRDADTPAVAALLADCPVIRVAKDEPVEDGLRARLYIVLSGSLGVQPATAAGAGEIQRILPGESVGEQSVLDDAANLDAITALETSELLVIEPDLVWQLIDTSNGVARNLLRLLSFRIRAANMQLRRRQKLGEFYRQLSLNDGLTGLYNRAWLNDVLPRLVSTAHATRAPLSLVMLDLDHFKAFNDRHGHLQGDSALRTAAHVLAGALRPTDFAVRYGGEELMVILPDTPGPVAAGVAERLCERMREALVFDDMRVPLPHVTASFGVASLAEAQDDHALIAAADGALYRAKAAGRDRVVVA